MFCTNCGKQFDGNFCPQCGTPVVKDVASPSDSGPLPTTSVESTALHGEHAGKQCSVSIGEDALVIRKHSRLGETKIPYTDIVSVHYSPAGGTLGPSVYVRTKANYKKAAPLGLQVVSNAYSFNFPAESRQELYDIYLMLESIAQKNDYNLPGLPTATQTIASTTDVASIPKDKPLSKRERIKENKANGIACCPKCGSTSLSAGKQGFGGGKAILGTIAVGLPGALAGTINAKKTHITCLNCGNKWKL